MQICILLLLEVYLVDILEGLVEAQRIRSVR